MLQIIEDDGFLGVSAGNSRLSNRKTSRLAAHNQTSVGPTREKAKTSKKWVELKEIPFEDIKGL